MIPGKVDDDIYRLERQLIDPAIRNSARELDSLLADDFVEFGASGRRFNKTDIVEMLGAEATYTSYSMEDFCIRPLGSDTVLATYRVPKRILADGATKAGSNRSSVWERHADSWKLVFHQGTPIPE